MLKAGIAGLKRGKVYVDCFRKAGAEVTALCATHEEVVKQAGEEFGISNLYTQYEDFLKSDIDIVVVSTPLPVHAEQSIAALYSGKHVLSEVPPVNSLEEGLVLRKAVKETKKKYM
ncbi:MAG: Gfo/Idh/MocA family oxidoreductase, partial [Candidatus Latescibacteria bacterium]|nr:Gfo/Idh/MocA family oxidoreductase [Candidatus Latescibacterota bacterium]